MTDSLGSTRRGTWLANQLGQGGNLHKGAGGHLLPSHFPPRGAHWHILGTGAAPGAEARVTVGL